MARRLPKSALQRQQTTRQMTPGVAGGRTALVAPEPRQAPAVASSVATSEVAPFSQYGVVTLTTAADSPTWVVGQGGGTGGLIDAGTLNLETAGSTSTVITVYVNGASIGTVTYASSDTTPQTDALTPTRVVVGDRVKVRVTTAGTGAKGLSAFVPIAA